MIRKDVTLDTDRPHFYSQYWIDVAAGRHDGNGAATAVADFEDEEPALTEIDDIASPTIAAPEMVAPEVVAPEIAAPIEEAPELPPVKPARATRKTEPKKPEPARPALTSLADLAKIDLMMKSSAEMDAETVPDLETASAAPEFDAPIVTDFDPNAVGAEEIEAEAPAAVAEDEFGESAYDEDEEDEWKEEGPRRGSKPQKRQRREPRREF
ncbi:MAG TPA: hypothetical protein VIC85_15930 [Ktedonobacterales bacterium]|jgi:hypothetical protein